MINAVPYWDTQWEKRTQNGIQLNVKKAYKLLGKFMEKEYYEKLEKLDIGCGLGHICRYVSMFGQPEFENYYTGIDESKVAIDFGKKHGLNVVCGDILKYEFDKKFDAFLLLDSLEHIEDHLGLANKIRSLAKDRYYIVGNIPLYQSDHVNEMGGFEHEMNSHKLTTFLHNCGAMGCEEEIYGCFGFPYMFFETMVKK